MAAVGKGMIRFPYQSLIVTPEDRLRYEALGLAHWPKPTTAITRMKMERSEINRRAYRKRMLARMSDEQAKRDLQDQVDLINGSDGQKTPLERG